MYNYKALKNLNTNISKLEYIQSIILKKTQKSISFECSREIEDRLTKEEVIQQAIVRMNEDCIVNETATE